MTVSVTPTWCAVRGPRGLGPDSMDAMTEDSSNPRWNTPPGVDPVPPVAPRSPARSGLSLLRALDRSARPDLKRAVPAVLITLLSFVIGERLGGLGRKTDAIFSFFGRIIQVAPGYVTVIVLVLAVIFVLVGVLATRSVARELARVSRERAGLAAASAIRLIVTIVGYGTVVLGLLGLLNVDLGNLLVGGAVTGVVIGIAAQQTLGNFFAGLVLLFARPYVPGQRVKVRTGAMGGPFEGVIVSAGLLYTVIETEAEGPISMPNSGLLAAAIGPAPEPEPTSDAADHVEEASGAEESWGDPKPRMPVRPASLPVKPVTPASEVLASGDGMTTAR